MGKSIPWPAAHSKSPSRGVSFLLGETSNFLHLTRVLFLSFHGTRSTFRRFSTLLRRLSRHSSNRNTCNSGRAWTHTVRGLPPTFTRNLDTFAETHPCFRSVRGLRTSPRSTNETLSTISPAETVAGLRLRRSVRTDIVRVLSSSWADLCATTCWPRIECVHADHDVNTYPRDFKS